MSPGVLIRETPCLTASPLLGKTSPAYPSGIASATPVPTTARPPGLSSAPSTARRSYPASPACALSGTRASGTRRRKATLKGPSGGIPLAMLAPECAGVSQIEATAREGVRGAGAPVPEAFTKLVFFAHERKHEREETALPGNVRVALRQRAVARRTDRGRVPAGRRVRPLPEGARRGRGLRLRHRRARRPHHPDRRAGGQGPPGGGRLLVGAHEGDLRALRHKLRQLLPHLDPAAREEHPDLLPQAQGGRLHLRGGVQADVQPDGGPLPAGPLRRGHVPGVRLQGGPRRPVRQLRLVVRGLRAYRSPLQGNGRPGRGPRDDPPLPRPAEILRPVEGVRRRPGALED